MLLSGDILVSASITMLVVMMVVPLPPFLLDILLCTNLSLSVIVMLSSMYVEDPLEFSIFPSLLLVMTLFRLALNVSSTRLILLHGYAGDVIQRFGEFVVGGNPVVGFIIFIILVVIQFIVITRGAERVAEVAARFTLDAMPGKQMSIDADLNAGLITEEQAKKRRADIQREADFYGAMDGAAKFVKGDAIAGLIITAVDLVGGFVIGMIEKGLPFGQALQRYSLLTVGDGLVTQIPALLVSTATGIIVTRAASESNMGQDLLSQLLSQPRAVGLAAGLVFTLAVVPGLPHIPLLLLASILGLLAWRMPRRALFSAGSSASGFFGGIRTEGALTAESSRATTGESIKRQDLEAWQKPENLRQYLEVDPLGIEIGFGLLSLAEGNGGGLLERIRMIRLEIAQELGFFVPAVRLRDNIEELGPNEYAIKLKGVRVAKGELIPDHYLAMNATGAPEMIDGILTKEPVFGLPAWWVTEENRERLEVQGYTVVDCLTVIATHLTEVIKTHAHELLDRQGTKTLLDAIRITHPTVVDEVYPSLLGLGEIQKVLQNLLREGIPIKDLPGILEAMADGARITKDADELTEIVRRSMKRQIAKKFGLGEKAVPVIVMDPDLERRFLESMMDGVDGKQIALHPDELKKLSRSLGELADRAVAKGATPIILVSATLRPYVRRLVEKLHPRIAVISYSELYPGTEVESLGVVSL
ncbi:MAG TPA: flagellar biosynthesis protein FlhA [Clostridia bacterium]|nr:flagellar biosynthesis protein FlhA [Clostridia bacterium]